jgi:hypothetical protein
MNDDPRRIPLQREAPQPDALIHPAYNGGSAAASPVATAPLAALLTSHIIQDGEIILLILKPSLWFIILSMLRFAAVILIGMIGGKVFDDYLPGPPRVYVEVGMILLVGRLMWAVLQWMSRLYILTDLRIIRLSGVFTLDVFDCPLRKIARTRILYTVRERILGLGSIEIIPSDENYPIGMWQTIARPIEINDQIVAAINRAKGRCE